MEKLIEGYKAVNTNATIELQTNDSTAGMKATMDGTCDIGMASRDLKESELAVLKSTAIAMDGIAVIVNNENPMSDISSDIVKEIYIGNLTSWDEVK